MMISNKFCDTKDFIVVSDRRLSRLVGIMLRSNVPEVLNET